MHSRSGSWRRQVGAAAAAAAIAAGLAACSGSGPGSSASGGTEQTIVFAESGQRNVCGVIYTGSADRQTSKHIRSAH